MYRKKKASAVAMGLPTGIGVSLLIGLLITLVGSAIAAWMVSAEKIGEGTIGYVSMVILFVAVLVGAWSAVTLVKRLRLQVAMLFGGFYYILLLAMTALFFGGQYQGMGVTALIVLAGSTLVAFWPGKKLTVGKRKKGTYR